MVRDDKSALRVDANSRLGLLSGYYFIDDYRLDNPYPGQQGGASVPGFNALTVGRAQLFRSAATRSQPDARQRIARQLHAQRQPDRHPLGGQGVSVASQGFVTGPGTPGIVVQAPAFEGVENVVFNSFAMGVTTTGTDQVNNTLHSATRVEGLRGAHR